MRKPLSRVCECYICEDIEITNQDFLPEGWVILWDYPVTICQRCLAKWIVQWGEPGILLGRNDA